MAIDEIVDWQSMFAPQIYPSIGMLHSSSGFMVQTAIRTVAGRHPRVTYLFVRLATDTVSGLLIL